MKFSNVPFALLRLQYQFVRFPLQLIEDRVFARMPSESPARLSYERSLGVMDTTVGHALRDPEMAERGIALTERSETLGRAARLDTAATRKQERADDKLNAERQQVSQEQRAAREERERKVSQARTAAADRKRTAAKAAQQRTAAAKQQADEAAARRTSSVEAAKRLQEAEIRAAEQKATAAAQSKREEARAKHSEAASKGEQADRVEHLANAEKQNRQSERANNNA